MFRITDYGAVADGVTVNSEAIQRAVDACASAGGGTVEVPAGTFVTGTVWLRSGVELHLCHGAVLKASTCMDDYNAFDAYSQNYSYPPEQWVGKHLILAVEVENVAVTGSGTVDGSGCAFYDVPHRFSEYCWMDGIAVSKDKEKLRPGQLICFIESENILVENITVRDATCWCCYLHGCRYARIRGLRISNPSTSANTDGIDLDLCSYVTVSDCVIETGDDAIAIRCNKKHLKNTDRVCEHITVSNCVLSSCSSVFRIGIGDGTVRHLRIGGLTVFRGSVLFNFMLGYGNSVFRPAFEDIHVSGVSASGLSHMLLMEGSTGTVRDFSMTGVSAEVCACSRLCALPGCDASDILLRDIRMQVSEPFADASPERLQRRGDTVFAVKGIRSLRMENVALTFSDGAEETWTHRFTAEDCPGLSVRDCGL